MQALLNEQKALVAAVTTAERNKQTQVKLAEEAYQQRIAEAASAAEEMQVTPLGAIPQYYPLVLHRKCR